MGPQVGFRSRMESGRSHYKRTPRGFDPDHRNAEFLLFNTLFAGYNCKLTDEIHSHEFVNWCFERFKMIVPLHKWIVAMTNRARK